MLPDSALSIVSFSSTPYQISFLIMDSELEQQTDAIKKTSIEGFEVTLEDISFKGTWIAHFCRPGRSSQGILESGVARTGEPFEFRFQDFEGMSEIQRTCFPILYAKLRDPIRN